DLALVADEDILRRNIAMNDAQRLALRVLLAMCVVEAFADLRGAECGHHRLHGLLQPAKTILYLKQIFTPDVLHGDEVRVADTPELEDLTDVGVRELSGDLRFIDKHLDEFLVFSHRRQDSLDG